MPEQLNGLRSIKDLTLKARFLYNYGADEEFYQTSIDYMKYWHDKLFYWEESSFKKAVATGALTIRDIPHDDGDGYDDMEVTDVDYSLLIQNLRLNNSMKLSNGHDQASIEFNQGFDKFERSVQLINCGGLISSLKWLHGDNTKSYLVVSVITGDQLLGAPELSIFYHGGESRHIKSCLQIWEISHDNRSFKLLKILDTSKYGSCIEVSWVPNNYTNVIGIVSGIFKDGKVHFFKINDSQQFGVVTTSSLCYELTNGNKLDTIISFDYLSNDRIIVGTVNGYIAEFILPNYNTSNDISQEDQLAIPSFIHFITDSPVQHITIGNPYKDKYIVNINTHGTHAYAMDYDNLIMKVIETPFTSSVRSRICAYLNILICNDALDVLSFSFLRHINEKPTQILKIDGCVSCVAASKILNHPLILSGTSYGEIYVLNVARRILQASKTNAKSIVPLKLWKIAYMGVNEYYFDPSYEIAKVDRTNDVSPSPQDVNIGSIDWNENINSGSMYAAGTHGGVLIIEKLDS